MKKQLQIGKINPLTILLPITLLAFTVFNPFKSIGQNSNPDSQRLLQKSNVIGFVENKGQILDQNHKVNSTVLYSLSLPGMNVELKNNGFSYDTWIIEETKATASHKNLITLNGIKEPRKQTYKFHRVDVLFPGSNPNCQIVSEQKGADNLWYSAVGGSQNGIMVNHFGKVTYKELYPGIDLEFIAKAGANKPVEYNFILHPGADASLIRIAYQGALNAILKNGELEFKLAHGTLKERIPASWIKESGVGVNVQYNLVNSTANSITLGLKMDKVPSGQTLIIDPTPALSWSTYYGGDGDEYAYTTAIDGSGNIFIAGNTSSSSSIATSSAYQNSMSGASDAYLVKFNSSGSRQWATYFGGSDYEEVYSIAADGDGNVYLTGLTTSSSGIATSFAYQTTLGGDNDAFLAKFGGDGAILWSTYIGGSSDDVAYSLALDGNDYVYVAGFTKGDAGIGTSGTHQPTTSGFDAFLVKFNSSGTLQWGTYYGGSSEEIGYSVKIDKYGYVYLGGTTGSSDSIATDSVYQGTYGGSTDGFLAKFNGNGVRQWGTYYGGSGEEYLQSITIDSSSNIYCTGYTSSTSGIASSGALQTSMGGGTYDSYLAKFNNNGALSWATYIGGSEDDAGFSLVTDDKGFVYFGGVSGGTTGIATAGSYQSSHAGGYWDACLIKFNANGSRSWGTYFGGAGEDICYSLATGNNGTICMAGFSDGYSDITTSGSYQPSFGGGSIDAFLAKFEVDIPCGAKSPTTTNAYVGNISLTTQTQLNNFFKSSNQEKYTKIIGNLTLDGSSTSDPISELCNLGAINEITGSLEIRNFNQTTNPTNLSRLGALTLVGCSVNIHDNPKFTGISMNISSVGCAFIVKNNVYADSIKFDYLQTVKGDRLEVTGNARTCKIYFSRNASSFSFTGKGSSINISNNGNNSACSLVMDFNKITSVKGPLLFNNNDNVGVRNFDSIFGNLTAVSTAWGKLTVTNNDYLAKCCIAASATVSAGRVISGNKGNCLNINAVIADCGSLHKKQVTTLNDAPELMVYPNPSNGRIVIAMNNTDKSILHIIVTDLMGRNVFEQYQEVSDSENMVADLSHLVAGQYVLHAETNGHVWTNKISLIK